MTGGAGFVGSHLVDKLVDIGADVTILDNLSHGRYINPDADFVNVDTGKASNLIKHFSEAYAVFNLAATVAGVQWNQDNNTAMFSENIPLMIAPVIAASSVGVPHFIQMSSVCIYAPDNQNSPDESTGYKGFTHKANWGYGQAKRDGELAAMEWASLNHVVVARPTNMFGPRDHFSPIEKAHVVPALIRRIDSLPNGKPDIEILGSPNTVREFLYVKDTADALVHLANNTLGREAYNIGSGGETAVTIRELVNMIADALGKRVRLHWNKDFDGGDDLRKTNVSKISDTGWCYSSDLQESIEETIRWYRKYKESI